MRILEQIGSYAGLAAIPGLAVLSALYFSQARDVRRLREWAGRAPERAAEQAVGGRVTVLPRQAALPGQAAEPGAAAGAAAGAAGAAQPAAAAAGAAGAAQAAAGATAQPAAAGAGAPAVKPAVAAATAAGAKPATAAAAATGAAPATVSGPAAAGEAATPAGRAAAALGDAEKPASGDGAGTDDASKQAPAGANGTTEGAEAEEGAAAKQPAKPGALTPAAVASAAAAKSGAGGTRTGPPAVGGIQRPATAGATAARRQIPSLPHSSKTSVLGKGARPVDPWYRRLGARLPAGRYVALIVAGALVLGGGAAFAISQLAGGDDKGSSSSADQSPNAPANPGEESPPKKDENVKATPTVDPSKVTVTVVNGTTIPNLARDTAAKLSQIGFQIGNKVTGTGSLAAAESVVEYRPGAEEEARYVAAKLNISQKQPADPDAIAQAGPAQVIVVLGADQAPGG